MIVRRKWLVLNESYVEVRYDPHWFKKHADHSPDLGMMDIFWFVRDPRKAQYHKPKFRSRASFHGPVERDFDPVAHSNATFGRNAVYRKAALGVREIFKELRLTSSVRRAAA